MNNFWLSAFTLLRREVVRFLRQKNRIVGALGTPLVFWILIGSGLKNSFRAPGVAATGSGVNYLQYFFPGTIVLTLLFTAIFSTISVIEDRREGFLQGVLVAPVSRAAIVFGNLLGGTTLATLQGLLFVCLSPVLGIHLHLGNFLYILTVMVLMAFALTGLGFSMAWKLDSTQGFHALMNLFLMPLWLLSGALFPAEGVPSWLQWVMRLNPLTYSVTALQRGFYADRGLVHATFAGPAACLWVSVGFAVAMFALAVRVGTENRAV